MRQLVLKMSMSVDGFVGGPNSEIGWIFDSVDAAAEDWVMDQLSGAGLHIMGRRTFNDMAAHWPRSKERFAGPMNAIPKAYFSRGDGGPETTNALRDATAKFGTGGAATPEQLESWQQAQRISGNLAVEVSLLKEQPGKEIMAHGGASFVQDLIRTRLIDEYRLLIHPVALGAGLRLFASTTRLQLIEAKTFPGGAVAHIYRPASTVAV